jgi:outer membrane protein TolC
MTVAYGNNWGGWDQSANLNTNEGRIEAGFALTLNIPILDNAGFFQMDTSRINRINLEKTEIGYRQVMIQGEKDIRTSFSELQKLQEQLTPLKDSFNASAKVLDRMVSEMATKKPSRLELRDAIKNAREKELELLKNVMDFIKARNTFYVQIGKDLEY